MKPYEQFVVKPEGYVGEITPFLVMEREDEDGTGWEQVAVYKRDEIERFAGVQAPKNIAKRFDPTSGSYFTDWEAISDEDEEKLRILSVEAIKLSGFGRFSRGAGQAFAHNPSARVYSRTVVVRQSGGLDV